MKITAKAFAIFVMALAAFVPSLLAQSTPIQYFYDDLGRLTKVIDQSGNIATYSYDAVGNILSISRSTLPANNALTILNVTPLRGKVGQTVTIQGQGFSAVPASNLVKFNGTTATVVTASASQLTVTVPSGATSGPLTLTVSGVTVSGGNFTVVGRTLISIFVTPAGSTFRKADTLQFTAHGTYDDGLTEDVTNLVTWNSSDPTIASISNTAGTQGLATGVSADWRHRHHNSNVSGAISGFVPLHETPSVLFCH